MADVEGEERRIDPLVGMPFTRAEFRECYGGDDEWLVGEVWSPEAGAAIELRIDIADGQPYTKIAFLREYGGTREWDEAVVYRPTSPKQATPSPPSASSTHSGGVSWGSDRDVASAPAARPPVSASASASAAREAAEPQKKDMTAALATLSREERRELEALAAKNPRLTALRGRLEEATAAAARARDGVAAMKDLISNQQWREHAEADAGDAENGCGSSDEWCVWCEQYVYDAIYCRLTGQKHVSAAAARMRRENMLESYPFPSAVRGQHPAIMQVLHVVAFADVLGVPEAAEVDARAWLQFHLGHLGVLDERGCRPFAGRGFAAWCPPR